MEFVTINNNHYGINDWVEILLADIFVTINNNH